MTGVLDGIRVLDFTWVVGGPLCTKYLAMLGAEVVKVESSTRPEHRKRDGQFELLNAGKYSCEVDLKLPSGQRQIRELLAGSDILVENFGVGVMARLGLSYEDVRVVRPDVIMLSLSGLGQEGPDSSLLAYGSLIQSYAGWTSLLCEADDLADDRLGMVPVWADHIAALMSTVAVLAAVRRRADTGAGEYIDVSILECVVSMMPGQVSAASQASPLPPMGNRSDRFAPHNVYPCAGTDRWIAIAAYDDDQWEALRQLTGLPRAGFSTVEQRLAGVAELDAAIARWTGDQDPWQLQRCLQAAGVPAAVSRNLDDLLADAHLTERTFFRAGTHGPGLGLPWLAESNPPVTRPAPYLGEHTTRYLEEM